MRINVGIADMKASADPSATLVTLSLGSCIGVAIYDPFVKVGGMIHYMLPVPLGSDSEASNPYKYCATGVPLLFKTCYQLGANKSRLIVKIAGGAEVMQANRIFAIGKKNLEMLHEMLQANNVGIDASDVGGYEPRTLMLDLKSGEVKVKYLGGRERAL